MPAPLPPARASGDTAATRQVGQTACRVAAACTAPPARGPGKTDNGGTCWQCTWGWRGVPRFGWRWGGRMGSHQELGVLGLLPVQQVLEVVDKAGLVEEAVPREDWKHAAGSVVTRSTCSACRPGSWDGAGAQWRYSGLERHCTNSSSTKKRRSSSVRWASSSRSRSPRSAGGGGGPATSTCAPGADMGRAETGLHAGGQWHRETSQY